MTETTDRMSMLDVLRLLDETDDGALDADFDVAIETDWRVGADGRLHIPKETREKYGIEEGDHLDAIIRIPGGGDG